MKTLMKRSVVVAGIGVASLGCMAGTALAEEEKPTADLTVGAYSAYIWRGQELSQDSVVIQPSMTIGYKGFSFGLWGNLDTDRYTSDPETNEWTETDLTLAYDWTMGPVGMTAGYIYYAQDTVGLQDSQEFFVSAALDTLLAPTLTIYRDTDNIAGWYITLGVSHSVPLFGDISLDLGAQASYLSADEASSYADPDNANEEYDNFADGLLSASVSFPVNEYISVTPEVYYSFPLGDDAKGFMRAKSIDGDDKDFVYGGVSVSLAF